MSRRATVTPARPSRRPSRCTPGTSRATGTVTVPARTGGTPSAGWWTPASAPFRYWRPARTAAGRGGTDPLPGSPAVPEVPPVLRPAGGRRAVVLVPLRGQRRAERRPERVAPAALPAGVRAAGGQGRLPLRGRRAGLPGRPGHGVPLYLLLDVAPGVGVAIKYPSRGLTCGNTATLSATRNSRQGKRKTPPA